MKRSGTLVSEQDIISKKSIEKLRTDRDVLLAALKEISHLNSPRNIHMKPGRDESNGIFNHGIETGCNVAISIATEALEKAD
jgi:hypothetical protein